MRISVFSEDPVGYRTLRDILERKMSVRVFLDGDQIRQDLIVSADSQAGAVVVWHVDDRGMVTLVTKTLVGRVQFKVF